MEGGIAGTSISTLETGVYGELEEGVPVLTLHVDEKPRRVFVSEGCSVQFVREVFERFLKLPYMYEEKEVGVHVGIASLRYLRSDSEMNSDFLKFCSESYGTELRSSYD